MGKMVRSKPFSLYSFVNYYTISSVSSHTNMNKAVLEDSESALNKSAIFAIFTIFEKK